MRRKKEVLAVTAALFLLSCGGGTNGTQQAGQVPPPAPPPPPPTSRSVQVFSAAGLGINIIPHLDNTGNLTGCTVIQIRTGEAIEFTTVECDLLVQEAQRSPGPYCQVLINNSPLSAEPSLCTRVVQDGQLLPEGDATAGRALDNANATLAYYSDHFGRRGIDDQGSDVVSIVHVGLQYANAFYNKDLRMMFYGDGDGMTFRDLTFGRDVAGHEMTHGVVSFSARLIYEDESGALDEATADFFGELIEARFDWKVGEDVSLTGKPVRDLADPASVTTTVRKANGDLTQVPMPAHVSEKILPSPGEVCGSRNDNCYVHGNATIIGHALYLLFQGLGQEKAEKIYYLALTQFFGPATDFQATADGAMLACRQLYDDSTCSQVANAFSSVGLTPNV